MEGCIIAARRKSTPDQMGANAIPQGGWPNFERGIQGEVRSMIEHYKALTPMTIEESERMYAERPIRTFPIQAPLAKEPGAYGRRRWRWQAQVQVDHGRLP